MDYPKRLIAIIFIVQVLFTHTEGTCGRVTEKVVCTGKDVSDLKAALLEVRQEWATELFVASTPLAMLKAGAFTAAYKKLYIHDNKDLKNIDPAAFASSTPSASKLYIMDCPRLGQSIWWFASKMSALNELALHNVGLTNVPANAFRTMSFLRELTLSGNVITTFEASLARLKLKLLDLRGNNLNDNSFSKNVFKGVGSIENLILYCNPKMRQLKETRFKGLLEAGTRIFVGRGGSGDRNYMQCKGTKWLCAKTGEAYKYREQVIGYECADAEFATIFQYCDSLSRKK